MERERETTTTRVGPRSSKAPVRQLFQAVWRRLRASPPTWTQKVGSNRRPAPMRSASATHSVSADVGATDVSAPTARKTSSSVVIWSPNDATPTSAPRASSASKKAANLGKAP